jgi:PTS system beta-glucosides-specific IIC component
MADQNIELARTIVDLVGGPQNIASVSHCVTRLRFKLYDEQYARDAELEALDDVLQVIKANGQYQVVIGPEVIDVFDAIQKVGSLWDKDTLDETAKKATEGTGPQGLSGLLIDLISSIVAPCLGCIASTGMIKGFLALWDFLAVQITGTSVTTSGAYVALYAISDAFWRFLPIMLGITAARRFKMNDLIGAAIGAAMCYPSIVDLSFKAFTNAEGVRYLFRGTLFEMPYATTFFGIPLVTPASSGGYTSTFVPVIIAVWASSYIFKWANEKFPATVKLFLVPMTTLILGGVATFLFIGPVSTIIMNLIGIFFNALMSIPVVGGTVAGAVLGALWQVLVIFGFHWALVPIKLSNMATYYYDFALAPQYGCTWAQIACVLVVILKTKDEGLKKNGIAAFITGLFGTTEPAIYGVTLPLRLPFVISCIGGAVSGAFYGLMGTKSFMMGYSGLLGLTSYIDARTPEQIEAWANTAHYLPNQGIFHMVIAAAGVIIAFAVGFVLTWLFWRPKEE